MYMPVHKILKVPYGALSKANLGFEFLSTSSFYQHVYHLICMNQIFHLLTLWELIIYYCKSDAIIIYNSILIIQF